MRRIHRGLAVAGLCAAVVAGPAVAQLAAPGEAASLAAIEADVDDNATEAGALRHARSLSARSDLSAAASALEAYLIVDESSQPVRAEYAITLCRLDDRQAGKFEAAKLVSMNPPNALVAAVTAACGALPDLAKLALGEELPQ